MQEPVNTISTQEHLSPILRPLLHGISLTDVLAQDVTAFLEQHGRVHTARHSTQVAAEARRVAQHVGEDPQLAEMAGWLHDCSAVFSADKRVMVARSLGLPVLPEEEQLPMIIHQKLSRVLAAQIFGITDERVLSAVECHTTLKAGATHLDKVVFVADKIAWDQPGIPPYHTELLSALEQSLDHAAFVYLRYLWERHVTLKVLHPWACEAYMQLSRELLIEEG